MSPTAIMFIVLSACVLFTIGTVIFSCREITPEEEEKLKELDQKKFINDQGIDWPIQ